MSKELFYEKLIESINNFSDFKEIEKLYKFIDRTSCDFWNIGNSFVISTAVSQYIPEHFRLLWNRDVAKEWLSHHYKQNDEKFLNDFNYSIKFFSKPVEKIDGNKFCYKDYCFFKIGNDGNQELWFFLPFSKEIPSRLYELFVLFCQRSFRLILQFREALKVSSLIYIDDVTGLYNQRKLIMDLDESVRKNEVYGEPFCVLFIDLDYFKQVNDNHGHLTGTKILMKVGALIKDVVRESDSVYRYGGDEFVVILRNADLETGVTVGERTLDRFKRKKFTLGDSDVRTLSVSIGVACYPDHAQTREDILEFADKMMYEAKRDGRGRVRTV